MDICIASDENYATILQVVMLSAMESNKSSDSITFHIFEYKMSDKSKNNILSTVRRYNRKLVFYSVDDCVENIQSKIDNEWANNNSYVAYARIFMADILPKHILTFLYLDCDVLINDDVSEIFNIELKDNVVAAVKDVLSYEYKDFMGFSKGNYYNSGVLYVNAKKWREERLTEKISEYCNAHPEDLFPDQDAINILLRERIYTLPPKYCVFYPENSWSVNLQIKGYGGNIKTYYSESELIDAKQNPSIIHYTDSVIGRPWQKNNINPYAGAWLKYYEMLPESNRIDFKEKKIGWKTKVYRIFYKALPSSIFGKMYYSRRNSDLNARIERIKKC